jgi:hypothetical protein
VKRCLDPAVFLAGLLAAATATAQGPAETATADARWLAVAGIEGRLNIRAEPRGDAAVLAGALPGTLYRNLGCVPHPDRVWCQLAPAVPGDLGGWAAADYLAPADSALRAGQGVFDRIGQLDCAIPADRPPASCVFGVARDPGGMATVVVTRPDGLRRALFFVDGSFQSTDASQAAGGFDTDVEMVDGVFEIRIDDERYAVPEAAIAGDF